MLGGIFVANVDVFSKIDYKLLEILNLIEHEPNFPILAKHVENYVNDNFDNCRLYNIYIEISKLRQI